MNQIDCDGTGDNVPSAYLVWFITGTSSGLGRALVHAALARGDCVVATARNVDTIRDFATNPETAPRVLVKSLDVRAPFVEIRALAEEVIEKWGRIDVLVNNAGVGMLGISEEVGAEGYRTQLNNNFFGPLNVTNAFLPYMRARKEGAIVFVGSRSSWRANIPMLGTYAASKAALTTMAESLAVEVAPLGIKVLNVLPGGMRTENWKKMSLLPTSPNTLLLPTINQNGTDGSRANATETAANKPETNGEMENEAGAHIVDYSDMRKRQIDWMRAATADGDAQKCAQAIIDIVTGRKNWPELNLLVLGADAERNIRDKCDAILRNLDDWKDVVRGIAFDREQT